MSDWGRLVARHSAALEEFALALRRIQPERWMSPIGPGKWTAAEIASHLSESYRVLRSELAGGPGMQLRLRWLHRWLLRYTLLPRILSSGKFPAGARAPRETRPREVQPDPKLALLMLRSQADAFMQELSDQVRGRPVRLTHAYFGSMTARQSLLLVIAHTRHHAQQLTAAAQ